MKHSDLERDIDRALKALPEPRAPRTLLPAVMLAVRAGALRPWYARPWATWPRGWQVASTAALALLVAGASLAGPFVAPYLAPVTGAIATVVRPIGELLSDVEGFFAVVQIVSRALWQSVIGTVLALFIIMLATSVAVGAAIGRVALGGVRH